MTGTARQSPVKAHAHWAPSAAVDRQGQRRVRREAAEYTARRRGATRRRSSRPRASASSSPARSLRARARTLREEERTVVYRRPDQPADERRRRPRSHARRLRAGPLDLRRRQDALLRRAGVVGAAAAPHHAASRRGGRRRRGRHGQTAASRATTSPGSVRVLDSRQEPTPSLRHGARSTTGSSADAAPHHLGEHRRTGAAPEKLGRDNYYITEESRAGEARQLARLAAAARRRQPAQRVPQRAVGQGRHPDPRRQGAGGDQLAAAGARRGRRRPRRRLRRRARRSA